MAVDGDTAVVGAYGADVAGKSDQGAAYVFVRSGSSWLQQGKLTAGDGAANDLFGYAVAVDGETAVVGAYGADVGGKSDQGAAYVFVRSGSNWSQQAKLTANDGAASDLFAMALALDGDTVVVGSFAADVGGKSDQGAAYVFVRSASSWAQQGKLTASDGTAGDRFGVAVAVDGDRALVGAFYAPIQGRAKQGAAYVFARSGSSWSQQQKLSVGDGASDDRFGVAVALDGDTLLAGASFAAVAGNARQGALYVFTCSGGIWSQQTKVTSSDGAANDFFGSVVALDGDAAVVGAPYADVAGNVDEGAAYMLERAAVAWHEQPPLVAEDALPGSWLGWSLALEGDTAVVGAPYTRVGANSLQGAVYIFSRSASGWSQQQKLTIPGGAAYDEFGYGVDLDGDTLVAGAPGSDVAGKEDQGAAYVFVRSGSSWSQQQRLTAGDGAAEDGLGSAVALDGDTILVEAVQADVAGKADQGAAYVFVRSGSSWGQQQKLVASDGAAGDFFGYSVAVDGDTAVVGAYHPGVYIFVRNGNSWSEQQKLSNSDGAIADWWGAVVAIEGDNLLVGAQNADVGDNENQGAVHLFLREADNWSQQQKLVASDGAAGDRFGNSVALQGEKILVGAVDASVAGTEEAGVAYLFVYTGSEWRQETKLSASDGMEGDAFGAGTAVDGDRVLVGARYHVVNAMGAEGAAYLYQREAPDEAVAGLVASNDSPTVLGQATTVMASVSAGSNINYMWDFGDGTTGSGATASHRYSGAGVYSATVTASNNASSATASTTVTVLRRTFLPLVRKR